MKNILLIEDDNAFAEKCIVKLLENGFNVKYADNPEKAKLLFFENKIDLLIIDLMLPPKLDIEGLNLYRFFRGYKNIPCIFMTSKEYKTTEIVADAMKLGASDFLDKETSVFFDKLIFMCKNYNIVNQKHIYSPIRSTIYIILVYFVLAILVISFSLGLTYIITLLDLPFLETFLTIAVVSISVIIIIVASQFRYEDKISEKTWLKVIKTRIVNFPNMLLDKISDCFHK